ncbi:hypothetical protein N7541_005243 [Penicillium brevicompactum]|uniref:Uncharacterized protein n=1 Tax=Penicillium brevicompactum TaxID=5074 RepID=A0A9W9RD46_PENBR|nr:hypothetical protein N7541_005243 [Penicillium brevicompactum]
MDKISITICGDGGCGTLQQPSLFFWNQSAPLIRCHASGFRDRDLIRSGQANPPSPCGWSGVNGFTKDSYSVTRTVDGRPYCLAITDTAGQEEYRGLWTSSTLQSDAFLLVYDITNPSSLETLNGFLEMIGMEAEQRLEDNDRLRHTGDGPARPPPVMIVAGNKCDLKEGRVVTSREGLEYARRHGCGFMETSAREMVNIEETFAHLVRRVVEARRLQSTGGHTSSPNNPTEPSDGSGSASASAPAVQGKTVARWKWFQRQGQAPGRKGNGCACLCTGK